MPTHTLEQLSEKMRDIDFAMMSTLSQDSALASRPMSNNGQVEYTGDSFFFTYDASRKVRDIERNPHVGLTFSGTKGLFGKPPIFISVQGDAELIHDRDSFAAHWVSDLERWFAEGIDTPGLVLIKVHARRIEYWDGEDQGELTGL